MQWIFRALHMQQKRVLNPLTPNSDRHQVSPCNINSNSTPEVMRIKGTIIQGEFS